MVQAVTPNTHSITGRALGALMEKTSSLGGLTLTQQPFRHERWVLAPDIQHLTATGVAGIGGRFVGLVCIHGCPGLPYVTANTLRAGLLLLKNLVEAIAMAKQCEEACAEFEEHRTPDVIHEWKMMKLRWEMDSSQPDPYQLVEKGMPVILTV